MTDLAYIYIRPPNRPIHFTTTHPVAYAKNCKIPSISSKLRGFSNLMFQQGVYRANIADDSIQWTNTTSKNGVPFEVGIRKTEHSIKRKSEEVHGDVAEWAWEAVYWPVDDSNRWKATSKEFEKRLFISRYKLYPYSGPLYEYTLEFTNTHGWDFKFEDEAGDQYEVNGSHWVRYTSDEPAIVWVGAKR